jgi:hypothetical protein
MHAGSCLCGAVAFEVAGDLPPPTICHCGQCRKQSGHAWCSTHVAEADVRLTADTGLAWFSASPAARRGFCAQCGSFLFWDPAGENRISIAMGAFDTPTGTRVEKHIFTAHKGDYYTIADGLPQDEN